MFFNKCLYKLPYLSISLSIKKVYHFLNNREDQLIHFIYIC